MNPGGDPVAQASETIGRDVEAFRNRLEPWSAYADQSWQDASAGTWGMQPRMLHMLQQLGEEPCFTPASNVVFVRSRDEAALTSEKKMLLVQCWPVHQAVIDTLGVQVVLCLGGTTGRWARERLKADDLVDQFKETNARGWKNEAHRSSDGRVVVTTTHPARADWRNPAADPTPLVKRMLDRRTA